MDRVWTEVFRNVRLGGVLAAALFSLQVGGTPSGATGLRAELEVRGAILEFAPNAPTLPGPESPSQEAWSSLRAQGKGSVRHLFRIRVPVGGEAEARWVEEVAVPGDYGVEYDGPAGPDTFRFYGPSVLQKVPGRFDTLEIGWIMRIQSLASDDPAATPLQLSMEYSAIAAWEDHGPAFLTPTGETMRRPFLKPVVSRQQWSTRILLAPESGTEIRLGPAGTDGNVRVLFLSIK